MGKNRVRVCLQDGVKLDLNRLARKGFIRRGANIGLRGITWSHPYWGDIGSGMISADMVGPAEGWFRIQLGSLDQRIRLVSHPRHFGGRQWYFVCPVMNRIVSVLCRMARDGFPADKPGADRSLISLNSTTPRAALVLERLE